MPDPGPDQPPRIGHRGEDAALNVVIRSIEVMRDDVREWTRNVVLELRETARNLHDKIDHNLEQTIDGQASIRADIGALADKLDAIEGWRDGMTAAERAITAQAADAKNRRAWRWQIGGYLVGAGGLLLAIAQRFA